MLTALFACVCSTDVDLLVTTLIEREKLLSEKRRPRLRKLILSMLVHCSRTCPQTSARATRDAACFRSLFMKSGATRTQKYDACDARVSNSLFVFAQS